MTRLYCGDCSEAEVPPGGDGRCEPCRAQVGQGRRARAARRAAKGRREPRDDGGWNPIGQFGDPVEQTMLPTQ